MFARRSESAYTRRARGLLRKAGFLGEFNYLASRIYAEDAVNLDDVLLDS